MKIKGIIGHNTAFKNEKNKYRKVSYKRLRLDKWETIQTGKLTA